MIEQWPLSLKRFYEFPFRLKLYRVLFKYDKRSLMGFCDLFIQSPIFQWKLRKMGYLKPGKFFPICPHFGSKFEGKLRIMFLTFLLANMIFFFLAQIMLAKEFNNLLPQSIG